MCSAVKIISAVIPEHWHSVIFPNHLEEVVKVFPAGCCFSNNRRCRPFSNEKRYIGEVTSDGCNVGLKASLVGVRTPDRFSPGKDKVNCTFGLETRISSCAPKGTRTKHLKLTGRVVMILNSPRVCEGWVRRRKPLRSLHTVLT